jgi:hypothetical protein
MNDTYCNARVLIPAFIYGDIQLNHTEEHFSIAFTKDLSDYIGHINMATSFSKFLLHILCTQDIWTYITFLTHFEIVILFKREYIFIH